MSRPSLLTVAEPAVLLALCVLAIGPGFLLPGTEALGHPTRDLFDHVALLDAWFFETSHWNFPEGGSLVPPDLFGMLLAAPFVGIDRAWAYNLALLGQLWMACVAAWALGRRFGSGMVAGAAFGLSPYLLGQAMSGEAETVSAWPLPLMILALEVGGWWGFGLAGLVAALGAVGSWYHGAFLAALMLAWLLGRGRLHGPARDLRALLAPAVFAGAVAAPAWAYAQVLQSETQLFRGPDMATYLAEHPRALTTMVSDPAAWLGGAAAGAAHTDFLGWLVVGLAGLGLLRRGDLRRFWWLAVLAGALMLAIGPVLVVSGAAVSEHTPYRLLLDIPLFGLMRLPHRWILVATLALAVLAAHGTRFLPGGTAMVLAGLVAMEAAWFGVPDRGGVVLDPPALHADLQGPVLDLPIRTMELDARGRYLVWQRHHGQPTPYALLMQAWSPSIAAEPLVQAVAATDALDPLRRRPVEAGQFRQSQFATDVAAWFSGARETAELDGAAARLQALGIRHVVLHTALMTKGNGEAALDLLLAQLGDPTDQDEGGFRWDL